MELIDRLIALDAALASTKGLRLEKFAEEWSVDPKTIRRQLKLLADLGCKTELFEHVGEHRHFTWHYAKGVRPLFTRNQ